MGRQGIIIVKCVPAVAFCNYIQVRFSSTPPPPPAQQFFVMTRAGLFDFNLFLPSPRQMNSSGFLNLLVRKTGVGSKL